MHCTPATVVQLQQVSSCNRCAAATGEQLLNMCAAVISGICLTSYPGLLTPAFVTCSTNAGEGLVKLSHVVGRTWTCGGVAHSFCTTVKRLSESKKRCQDCLMSSAQSFYGPCLRSLAHSLTCCFSGRCHSSTRPGTSYHGTQFYQAFPHVSTASDKRWGEKAWVRG